MRPVRWQCLAVAASLVWMVAAGLYQRSVDRNRAGRAGAEAGRLCVETAAAQHPDIKLPNLAVGESCFFKQRAAFNKAIRGSEERIALIAIVPAIIGWAIAGAAIALRRRRAKALSSG